MDKLDIQEFNERRMLTGLIVNVEYLKKVRAIWADGKHVVSPEICKIASWCFDHFDKHKKTPGKIIEDIYFNHLRDGTLGTAEAEIIERILKKISDEWELDGDGEYDANFYYDQTVDHFSRAANENLKDDVVEHLDRGEVDKAKALVRDHKPPGQSTRWQRADEIRLRPIYWHWKNVVPREELVLLAGYKRLGKSQIMISIAAIASSGGCWPDGTENKHARDVIIISAEDPEDSVIGPRLVAAGADMSRCHLPRELPENTTQAVELTEQLLNDLPNKGRGSIVWVDPVTAFMGTKDPNNVVHVRSTLRPFVEMGHRRGVTVIAIHHLRKAIEGNALDLVLGSGGFTHAARVVHLVFPDAERSGRNLFLAGANNLGAEHPGYAYQIVPETVTGSIETSRVAWETSPINMNADQALALLRKSKTRSKTEDAKRWLKEFLSNGPVAQTRIQEEAQDAGMTWATIKVAKNELKIRSERQGGRNGEWVWKLPTMD